MRFFFLLENIKNNNTYNITRIGDISDKNQSISIYKAYNTFNFELKTSYQSNIIKFKESLIKAKTTDLDIKYKCSNNLFQNESYFLE